jgi:hypothetical protein
MNVLFLNVLLNSRKIALTSTDSYSLVMEGLKSAKFDGSFLLTRDDILTESRFFNFTYSACKDDFTTISVVMYFRKNFYLTPEINEVISNLESGGLIEFWHKRSMSVFRLNSMTESNEAQKMTIEHLLGCFEVWAIGICIAIGSLSFEILILKLKKILK